MSFESCFGGFAGWKSVPAAMGGFRSFADTGADGKVAPFQTFRARPAMEAGVSKRLWSLAELVERTSR